MKNKILLSILIFIAMLLIFMIPQCFADETIVEIQDPRLKLFLVNDYDLNHDREMSISEMEAIESLFIRGYGYEGGKINSIEELKYCTNLTRLYLFGNNITDITPLSNLTNLTYLDLGENNITDITALSNLTNLTSLNLTNNVIFGLSPLTSLTNLTYLNIHENKISDISELNSLTNLETLIASHNYITAVENLSGLSNLQTLNLSNNYIKSISGFDTLPNLTSLDLTNNIISEVVITSGFSNLKYLHLDSNLLEKIEIRNLENLLGFATSPYPYGRDFKNNNTLKEIILSDLPKLTNFYINGKTNLKDVTIQNMNSLETIFITDCTVESLTLDTLPVLTTLNCKANRISSLENLNNLPKLQSVNFIANNISDISPLTRFPKLAVADMRENPINQEDSGTQATIYQLMEYGPFELLLSDYVPTITTVETKDVTVNDESVEVMPVGKGTDISNFINEENFPIINTYTITVYDASGNEKAETEKLGSRNIIKITNSAGDVLAEYTVIVPGDVTGNGEVKMYDSFVILKGTLFSGSLDAIETLIRDYNKDGSVKMFDAFAFLKQALFN